jgi:hypothetical protein
MWRRFKLSAVMVLIASFMTLSGVAMAVDEPEFKRVIEDGDFELREYPGFIVAETWLTGDFDAASRAGFRRIAAYIFGDNQGAGGASRKIAMTAPVTVEAAPPGEVLDVSAMPVHVQADADRWRIHFVMPAQYSLADLPAPNDASVVLREVGAHRMAVVRFSGFTTRASLGEQSERLSQWVESRGLTTNASPQVARYDDPFTLPWRRRNEIMVEVQ